MIESAPNSLKRLVIIIVSLGLFTVASNFLYGLYQSKTSDCVLRTKNPNPASNCVALQKADTKESRIKGLSGKQEMATNQGMLFVFDNPGKQCMWMKDMNFTIDIVWINSGKIITKVSRDVSPKTYPKSFCGTNKDVYVIETVAGAVDAEQLSVGKQLNL